MEPSSRARRYIATSSSMRRASGLCDPRPRASILADEEKHIDYIETQFEMIQRMGLQNYIQLQSEGAEEG
jgi:bacterioferritin (cytochrome b1)